MRFFTSDLHLGHTNIIKYCNRPFSDVESMNKSIIERINSVVKANDTLWILGDIAMGRRYDNLELLQKLKSRDIHIVAGNHDTCHPIHARKYPDDLEKYKKLTRAKNIYTENKIYIGKHKIIVSHFPYKGDSYKNEDRYASWRPSDKGEWLLCGHVHEKWRQNRKMINVGVDAWGGYPVSEEDILQLIAKGSAERGVLNWVT